MFFLLSGHDDTPYEKACEALMYIQKLSFTEAETTLLAHAKALVKSAPTETTNLLMTICTPKGTHHYFCCVVCVLFCPLGCTDPPPTPHHPHQVAENGAAAKNNTKTKKNNECAATPKRICRHSWITAATGTTNSPINWNCDGKTDNDENIAHIAYIAYIAYIAHIAYIDSLTHHHDPFLQHPRFLWHVVATDSATVKVWNTLLELCLHGAIKDTKESNKGSATSTEEVMKILKNPKVHCCCCSTHSQAYCWFLTLFLSPLSVVPLCYCCHWLKGEIRRGPSIGVGATASFCQRSIVFVREKKILPYDHSTLHGSG